MKQAWEGQRHQQTALSLTNGESLAIWALRRFAGGARRCYSAGTGDPPIIERELAGIADVFRDFFQQPDTDRIRSMQLGVSGSLVMTKDERRLRNMIAAAQAEDAVLLDNYLYRLALDRTARDRLAEAVASLAACLAVYGYWLPRPLGAALVPAAALLVARAHGHDMCDVRVAWP